jgi:LysM repeat protein
LSQSQKVCPICHTPNHHNAQVCTTCGTTLTDVEQVAEPVIPRRPAGLGYNHEFGEMDLSEDQLRGRGETVFFGLIVLVLIALCVGLTFGLASAVYNMLPNIPLLGIPTPARVATSIPTVESPVEMPFVTNTPRPTLDFDTVTPQPPSATPTPTQGPCMVIVGDGDDLITLAYGCGHRSLDIVDLILELNDLDAPENIQVGQTLEIPWPTPTDSPEASLDEEGADTDSAALIITRDGAIAPAEEALLSSFEIATETLQPGITFHRVAPNESAAGIAALYGANIEILSQLNPEITFSQCDFGAFSGGPNCIVQIFAGQLMRVPAPTAVPTLSPTPSGSETATPRPSPTFNAPSLSHPPNRTLFRQDELITLRWVPTGTLSNDEVYRVQLEDLTAGEVYTADTRNIFFIVPEAWQGDTARRHEYRWSMRIFEVGAAEPSFSTGTRLFSWEGRGVVATATPEEGEMDENSNNGENGESMDSMMEGA